MKYIITFCLLLFIAENTSAQQTCPIIPKPVTAIRKSGTFQINNNTHVAFSTDSLKPIAAYLQRQALQACNIHLSFKQTSGKPAIKLVLDSNMLTGDDGYRLSMSPQKVTITAKTTDGMFNGVISFLQLATFAKIESNDVSIACWDIRDEPLYNWRGFMLDESRHFFGKEKVKSLLDWMAFYKLNRFHWHLTDEPGWRLEIKAYPQLALTGGIGNYSQKDAPAKYYTQQEIKEIVQYALERHIVVIPEIDMPGHATAANKAYPQYSGGGSKGHPDFTFNPGLPQTYTYLGQVLKETKGLFPSGMIHIGGDEVSVGNEQWKTDTSITALLKNKGLSGLKDVEQYFIRRMADSVYKMNAKLLVWDEMAGANLSVDKTMIFWWRHDKQEQLKLALDKGYTTILCPRLPFYFDFVQDSLNTDGRKWSKKYNSIQNVYLFNAGDYQLTKDENAHIEGIQANLWTETVNSDQRLDYLLFPRISALAEAAWTQPASRGLEDFMRRLKANLLLYKKAKIYYYNPFLPGENPEPLHTRHLINDN